MNLTGSRSAEIKKNVKLEIEREREEKQIYEERFERWGVRRIDDSRYKDT